MPPSSAAAAPAAACLPADWAALLSAELSAGWYAQLCAKVATDRASGSVYPPADQTFTAFALTPLEQVRVVLLGQDPYHRPGQAHGLAFSVRRGVKAPPSLRNIYRELKADVGCENGPGGGCLEAWARQGVLLLNTVLTVREGEAGSHAGYGWEKLTDAVITRLAARPGHLVFVLWGAHARAKAALVDRARHTVVEAAHPSPLSQRRWFGSRPFSKIDAALRAHGQAELDWRVR